MLGRFGISPSFVVDHYLVAPGYITSTRPHLISCGITKRCYCTKLGRTRKFLKARFILQIAVITVKKLLVKLLMNSVRFSAAFM